jgi:hypothetical protein
MGFLRFFDLVAASASFACRLISLILNFDAADSSASFIFSKESSSFIRRFDAANSSECLIL